MDIKFKLGMEGEMNLKIKFCKQVEDDPDFIGCFFLALKPVMIISFWPPVLLPGLDGGNVSRIINPFMMSSFP